MEVNYYVFHFCFLGVEPSIIEVDVKHVDTSSEWFQKVITRQVNNHYITNYLYVFRSICLNVESC